MNQDFNIRCIQPDPQLGICDMAPVGTITIGTLQNFAIVEMNRSGLAVQFYEHSTINLAAYPGSTTYAAAGPVPAGVPSLLGNSYTTPAFPFFESAAIGPDASNIIVTQDTNPNYGQLPTPPLKQNLIQVIRGGIYLVEVVLVFDGDTSGAFTLSLADATGTLYAGPVRPSWKATPLSTFTYTYTVSLAANSQIGLLVGMYELNTDLYVNQGYIKLTQIL